MQKAGIKWLNGVSGGQEFCSVYILKVEPMQLLTFYLDDQMHKAKFWKEDQVNTEVFKWENPEFPLDHVYFEVSITSRRDTVELIWSVSPKKIVKIGGKSLF